VTLAIALFIVIAVAPSTVTEIEAPVTHRVLNVPLTVPPTVVSAP